MKKEILDLIDLNTPERYALSIRLASDGFCFSLCDKSDNGRIIPFYYKADMVSSELANIKGVFDDMRELLDCSFCNVNVLLDMDRVIAVPGKVFDEDDFKAAYCSCFELLPGEMVLHSVSEQTCCVFVFPVNKYVKQLLDETFGKIKYIPSVSPVVTRCSQLQKEVRRKGMFVYFTAEKMLVTVFDGSGLLFVNSFECDCDDDRLFYIMNIWKNLLLSQSEDVLNLVSDNVETLKLERRLGNYIEKIAHLGRNEHMRGEFAKSNVVLDFDLEVLITDNIINK